MVYLVCSPSAFHHNARWWSTSSVRKNIVLFSCHLLLTRMLSHDFLPSLSGVIDAPSLSFADALSFFFKYVSVPLASVCSWCCYARPSFSPSLPSLLWFISLSSVISCKHHHQCLVFMGGGGFILLLSLRADAPQWQNVPMKSKRQRSFHLLE